MKYLLPLMGIIIVFLGLKLLLAKSRKKKKSYLQDSSFDLSYMPYHQKYLLTKNEYSFYLALKKILDEEGFLICPKVRLADLFNVTDQDSYMKYFNKINRKHVDFLICDSELYPLYAIELDDKSHERESRKESDRFKDALFEVSDIRLIRIPASSSYDAKGLRGFLK